MRNWKRSLVILLCMCVMCGTVACGNNGMEQNDTNNDVTEGNDQKKRDDGVIDDVGDAVDEGINDIGNGVEDITDDITGNDVNHTNER